MAVCERGKYFKRVASFLLATTVNDGDFFYFAASESKMKPQVEEIEDDFAAEEENKLINEVHPLL